MTILVVQSKSGAGSSLSFTNPVASGNCVVAIVCDSSSGKIVSVSGVTLGGVSDNFSQAGVAGGSSASNTMAAFWVDRNCTGGSTAVSASIVNSADPVLHIYELNGIDPLAPLDLNVFQSTTTSSSFTSGSSGTSTSPNEIFIAAVCTRLSLGSLGTVSGFTNLTQNGASATKSESGYVIVTTTSSETYSSTISTSAPHAAGVISLKQGSPLASVGATTAPQPFALSAPYPLNIAAGSYAYSAQNPANIPAITFAEPNIAAIAVSAPAGFLQVNYSSSPQFPLRFLQAIPPNFRLSVFAPKPPTSSKAGVTVQGSTSTVTVAANISSVSVNYPSVQQFPLASNSPWPLPVVATRLKPQHSDQSRTYVAGIKASVTISSQEGTAGPDILGPVSSIEVQASPGGEYTRISYAVPFPFGKYLYPLGIISGITPQNPASIPRVYINGLTARETVQANFGVATALYPITPQFPFTNLALPLPLRKLRQQNFTAFPQHSFTGTQSIVVVAAKIGSTSESPHGNASSVTIHAGTPVTRISVSEIASNISIASTAKTTASVHGNVSSASVSSVFGSVSEAVSVHGSVILTPRFGSPGISVKGGESFVSISARTGKANISPHGNVSSVSSASSSSVKISITGTNSVVEIAGITGSPKIIVTDKVNNITVKAYIEGVSFTGTVAHAAVSAVFGGVSVNNTGELPVVSCSAHIGLAGGQFIVGHLESLFWDARLIRPVE